MCQVIKKMFESRIQKFIQNILSTYRVKTPAAATTDGGEGGSEGPGLLLYLRCLSLIYQKTIALANYCIKTFLLQQQQQQQQQKQPQPSSEQQKQQKQKQQSAANKNTKDIS